MREAVAVLVSRRPDPGRYYLVKRNPRLRFFGGFWALPGGTLDSADHGTPIKQVPACPKGLGKVDLTPYLAAAARELFEETGLWVVRGGKAPPRRNLIDYRRRLLAGEITIGEILEREDGYLVGGDFEPLGRFVTPTFAPLRYDTWYLRVRTRDDQIPEVWPGELESGRFFGPGEALDRWRSGELPLVPPLIDVLARLKESDSDAREITSVCRGYLEGILQRIYFSPGVLTVPLKTLTRPPATHTNAYLVGERRLYLIDPGCTDRQEQERLWGLIDGLLAEGRRLQGILLTHSHADHVGAVEECRKRYSTILCAHPAAAGRLAVPLDRTIAQGDALDLGEAPDGRSGWRLEVDHLPGHAPDHLAFRESRYGAVFAGDLVSPLSSILVDPDEGRLSVYMQSLERLAAWTEGFLYPGHGPPVRTGRHLVEKTLTHRRDREQKLLQALDATGQSLDELLTCVYDDVPDDSLPLARRSLLSGLIDLQERGLAAESDGLFRAADL